MEPDWRRFTDLRADRLYTSIVRAIAMGAGRPSVMAQAIGRQSAAEMMPPLQRLIDAGIIVRIASMTTRQSGKDRTRYELADPFLAFWYRFIDPRRGLIRRARTVDAIAALATEIANAVDEHIARNIFETVCREWVWDMGARGLLPVDLTIRDVGTWWSGSGATQDEIDVVALSPSDEGVLYGECKWSQSPVGPRDLGGIRAAIHVARNEITPSVRPWHVLFSRSGFHPELQAEAASAENHILLVGLDDLYRA